jgi:hypothetical protein
MCWSSPDTKRYVMGWSASWIAVDASREVVLEALDLNETGEEVMPGSRVGRLSCATLPNGWFVVFSEDFDWATPERAKGLSRLGLAVACQFEDKVEMTSTACAARDGVEMWRVFHDSVSTLYRLDVSGEPPAELAVIRDRCFKEQDEDGGEKSPADFVHDVPLELAKVVCGYRHDDEARPFMRLLSSARESEAETPRRRLTFFEKLLAPLRPIEWDKAQ